MTIKEAIRRIRNYIGFLYGTKEPQEDICEAMNMAIAALREQEENRWVPVTERIPKEHDDIFSTGMNVSDPVLVAFVCTTSKEPYPKNCVVCESYTRNGKFKYRGEGYYGTFKAIAWKPLPAPPKEETT